MTTNKGRLNEQPGWSGFFDDVPEIDVTLGGSDIEGKIPEKLKGSLFRNGPGKHSFSASFFDGDGAIRALHLGDGDTVRYQCRYVHTKKYLEELGSVKPKVRTAGTNLPGGVFKNFFKIPGDEANTHVFWQDGHLLASQEGGHPWIMDPQTLETQGEEHFSGALPGKVAFSAHAHYDANTREIYNFGMKPGKTMGFQCYKINSQKKLDMLAGFPCHKGTFAHDYALSGKWMAFILPPLAGNMAKFLFGLAPLFDTMKWHEQWGTEIVLVPRDGGEAIRFEVDSFSIGHVIGAWDEGDEMIIDLGTSPDMSIMRDVQNYRNARWQAFGDGEVSRLRINTRNKTIKKETLCAVPAEFPRIHPKMECRSSQWAYLASNTKPGEGGLFRATMKLNRETADFEIFDFGENRIALEPIFVPANDAKTEDEGWILVLVYNCETNKSDFVILDARDITQGPIATIHLPVNAGTTFHGSWVDQEMIGS